MKPYASRYLLLVLFSLTLAACQTKPADTAPPPEPEAYQQLSQNITSNELATAEDQLTALQKQNPTDERLVNYQRQLAEAYLQRSQVVLQKGDVNAAASALARARALMPTAPALTSGVNGAIAHARKAELDQAEAAVKAAEARPPAKLLDPTAAFTPIELNIADINELRSQLDDLAVDIVNYKCNVILQVPRAADYPWLASLLKKRVIKQAPDLQWKIGRHLETRQRPIVVLIPSKP
ncbi:MAG: PA5502 family lipoprotein [Janthinobacterium lividum]